MGMGQPGLTGLLKSGYKHMTGLEEAILTNVKACKQLSEITRTSLGPNGMNKLVINHLEKIFITSDSSTICRELEVNHPAAKMLVLASKMQEQEVGDGANFVVTFGGELLGQAEDLLRTGVHPNDIVSGYKRAAAHVLRVLPEMAVKTVSAADLRSEEALAAAIRGVVASKQYGVEETLAPLVAKACVAVMPPAPRKPSLNVDNVRTAKLIGGTASDSQVLRGVVALRDAEGTIKSVTGAKIAVFGAGLEASDMETKGTVVIKSAEELKSYTKEEERRMEETIKTIADSGCNVVVSGGVVSEIALHFLEKYKLMCVKIISKFELRRLCRATGAISLVRVGAPTADEMGAAASVSVQELSGRKVTVFRVGDEDDTGVATIVLRGATTSLLDDMERAVGNAVNAVKTLTKDGRLLAGAGAPEVALSLSLQRLAAETRGLEQYSIHKFAEALEVVPRTLAENSGQDPTAVIAALYAAHAKASGHAFGASDESDASVGASVRAAREAAREAAEAEGGSGGGAAVGGGGGGAAGAGLDCTVGVDVDAGFGATTSTKEVTKEAIYDSLETKTEALRLAIDAALTVLRVDQIIMSKQAGGPKPRAPGAPDM